ncbi:MAG: hypothetical protein HPY66_2007 [Firmicutes bacterium]|nr:hypothetical protein [Bacillota bacterium]
MQLEKIKTIAKLVDRLKSDPVFRYNCGFDVPGNVPSTSTFSRFLTTISESEAWEKDFEQLVLKAKELNIVTVLMLLLTRRNWMPLRNPNQSLS